jgi:ribosomal protein S18 acetylase RimI-like enzyme
VKWQVREANEDDLPAICALGEEVNALHHQAWPHIFAPAGTAERDRSHWQQSLPRELATTFVAESDGVIAGFVTVGLVDETNSLFRPLRYGKVNSVSVTANKRGKGIGPALMAYAEQWAVARGAVDLRLNVWAFNEHALHVYKELGYELRSVNLGKLPSAGA